MSNWISDDITFCMNHECDETECMRHFKNIKIPGIPHSYAELYGTDLCRKKKNQPTTERK